MPKVLRNRFYQIVNTGFRVSIISKYGAVKCCERYG